jgi:hypothetical protein
LKVGVRCAEAFVFVYAAKQKVGRAESDGDAVVWLWSSKSA